jgi:hypothetical protein
MDEVMDQVLTSRPLMEIVFGTLFLIIIIFVHGAGIRIINRQFSKSWVQMEASKQHWRLDLLLAATIGSLAGLHFVETLLWAILLCVAGWIPSMRDSYFYVLESYTTLGEGNVSLPDEWRLIGPVIGISGLFTFGWTGSVLVSVMTDFGKLDRLRAKKMKDVDHLETSIPDDPDK